MIANPHAGSADSSEGIARRAADVGWRWQWARSSEDTVRLARRAAEAGAYRIVAAGGDGTVHLVVQGILSTAARPILAVLPLGTGNDLARTLGFGVEPEEVLSELIAGTDVRSIDLARARVGRYRRVLINGSAGGFSGEVDRALDAETKARWGAWAYVRGALEVLGDLPCYRVRARVDGVALPPLDCVGVTVMNGRTSGGGLAVAPDADLEDGRLDLLMVEHASKLALAGVAAQLRTGGAPESPHARHHAGALIELRADPPMPINVDGELLGDVRTATWQVLPGELRIAVGKAYVPSSAREAPLAPSAVADRAHVK